MKSRDTGIQPRKCSAKTTKRQPCKNYAKPGTTVCPYHGASAPHVANAADHRVMVAKVERRVTAEFLGREIPPVDDPLRALQALAGEALVWKDLLAEHVGKLQGRIRYDNQFGEQLRAEVVVFERAMDRAGELLAKIARLNIDERLAAIDAAKKLMVIRALEAGFASQGLTGPALAEAKRVAGRHLRMIAAGEVIAGEVVDGEPAA